MDKIKSRMRKVMRSNPAHDLLFIFQLENISRSNLKFSAFYGCSTDFKSFFGLLLVSFLWLGETISLKYLLIALLKVIVFKRLTTQKTKHKIPVNKF